MLEYCYEKRGITYKKSYKTLNSLLKIVAYHSESSDYSVGTVFDSDSGKFYAQSDLLLLCKQRRLL